MATFDLARYWIAVALVAVLPTALLLWFVVHPMVRPLRRLGAARSYLLLFALSAVSTLSIASQRGRFMVSDWGGRWPLAAAGVVLILSSMWMRLRIDRHFGTRVVLGLPELSPDRHPTGLVTSGLHARVRHPRYVQLTLTWAGWALLANYPASYAALGLWLLCLPPLVALEERELAARFGDEWERYRLRVPRFLPRLRPRPEK